METPPSVKPVGEILLRPGLYICTYDEENQYSWSLKEQHCERSKLILGFQLLGNHQVRQEVFQNDVFDEVAGEGYLCCVHGATEIETYAARSRLLRTRIHIEPDFLRTFSMESIDSFPCALKAFIEGDERVYFNRSVGKMTAVVQVAWQHILSCPYQGMMTRLYLESKVLEIITLQFAQLTEQNIKECNSLRARDIACIYEAKDLLNQCLENPPSLIELARQVGLNDYKLKVGFRQVFDTTVFGYLHERRMERAVHLLQETQLSLTEIAYAIGYACPASFSTTFRKKFGMSPRSYRVMTEKRSS
ncbi:AraC family transcriptional regulator [Gloeocapsopsis sp. IPPAS B-1203]|uniref:helix-turn-helix transcriptional regulator n=1 Tax=Gloeocapsopsis sp. IPPAS B-1203 TaxID=2049454 RepID=UPI000C1A05FC|nr:AraC family transcriptional regulator [Gloeocapsopsis sp. IPPAS B-1203]PIG91340.1 AraC family transcriptional regulator [Gloeocapsopsis sp. IPPAS B-1203]